MVVTCTTLFIFFLSSVSCISNSKKFERERNREFVHVFKSLVTRSHIECCFKCRELSACEAVTYSQGSKLCSFTDDCTDKKESDQFDVYYRRYTCESNWVLFGTHCYKVLSTTKSWAASEAYCNGLDSNLVDIQSEEENLFVRSLVDATETIWIGMYIESLSQERTWTNRNQILYQNFRPGEPNFAWENCVEMGPQADWNDISCDKQGFSVCKKPAD